MQSFLHIFPPSLTDSLGVAFRGLDCSKEYLPMISLRYKSTEVFATFQGTTYVLFNRSFQYVFIDWLVFLSSRILSSR